MPHRNGDDEVETIGTRVRDARESLGKTTAWLANELGISENAVKAIEDSTTKSPTLANGLRIARILGADPWWIAFGESSQRAFSAMLPANGGEVGSLEDQLRDLRELVAQSNDATRKSIEGLRSEFEALRSKRVAR